MKNFKSIREKQSRVNLKWATFVLPSLLFYLIFFCLPSVGTVYYSFTNWDGVTSKFIGLDNYIRLFQDKQIYQSLSNTIFYTIVIALVQNAIGLLLAVLLKKSTVRNNIFRTMIFMPYIFSSLLIGYVFKFMFESNIGSVNYILRGLGLESLIHSWLSDPDVAKWIIVMVTVWQNMGYTMVINIAGLQGIDSTYYEAAVLDGASRWQEFCKITFPLIAPATTINIMLSLIGNLQIFNQIYAITGGGPAHMTESIAVTVYRLGFSNEGAQWGYGAAMSVVMFVLILLLTLVITTMLRKREVEM